MVRAFSGEALDPEIVEVFLSVVPDGPLPASEELSTLNDPVVAEKEPDSSSLSAIGLPRDNINAETTS
jgi:hypothetical protein